ncbi:MAG: Glucose-phosphate thymidylyltransferase [Candidatus Parcubacteria bacterium]|jgi:bifunctional UDP-N-acetylglucosamine pyrophosphorylase/glucosamine-1-phosphate N-acetyltransferase
MQAVIMAAGLGTRLRPHTLTVPKPMLEVAGRPILEWTFASLPPEIDEIVLVVNYLKEQIVARFGDEHDGRRVRYVEQTELKGTGDALARCRGLLEGKFLVMNGDDLYGADDVAEAVRRDLAILAKATDVPGRFGAFRTDGRGNLVDIIEGADVEPGGLVNAGLYVLDERFFSYPLVAIKGGAEFGLPQTLVAMAKDHPIAILRAGFWLPIGYPEDLAKAARALSERDKAVKN